MASAILGGRLVGQPDLGPWRAGPLEDELLAGGHRVVHRRDPGRDRPVRAGRRVRGRARQADRRLDRLVDPGGRARRRPVRLRAQRDRPRRRRSIRGDSPVIPRLPGEEGRGGPGRSLRDGRDLARPCRPAGRTRHRRADVRRARTRHQLRAGRADADDARDHGWRLRPGDPHLHGVCDRGGAADRDVRRPDARDLRPRPRSTRRRSRPGDGPARTSPVPLADDPDADRVRQRHRSVSEPSW